MFNSKVSEAYHVEEKTTVHFTRLLKEAGLLTTGARGVNAPDMTPRDAARITIAFLATDMPSRAVAAVEKFGGMIYRPDESSPTHPDWLGIREGATFEEVITRLFEADPSRGDFSESPYIEVRRNSGAGVIEYAGGGAIFRCSETRTTLGLRRTCGVASSETMQLAMIFYLERRDGRSWEELEAEVR